MGQGARPCLRPQLRHSYEIPLPGEVRLAGSGDQDVGALGTFLGRWSPSSIAPCPVSLLQSLSVFLGDKMATPNSDLACHFSRDEGF